MKKIVSWIGVLSLCAGLAIAGCVQPQPKKLATGPGEVKQEVVKPKPAEVKKEVVATAEKKEESSVPVKEEIKGKIKPSKQLYPSELKPMTPAECGRCHVKVYETVLKEGGRHQFPCVDCHRVFHVFKAAEVWSQIVPKCEGCHGYPHGKNPAVTDCQTCHVEAHAPRRIPMSVTLENNCGKCHPKIIAEMKQFPSKHAPPNQKCSACHEKHGYIPSCLDCHEPHTPDLTTNQQCLACHPVHSPTRPMVFKPDTPNKICAACHEEVVDTLAANKSKHHDVACVECHTKHAYIPKCQECHGQPHSAALLKKFPNCLQCHIDPHNLPTKAATTSLPKESPKK